MGAAEPNFPKNLHVLIMAGGSGTRFWPKSRAKKPKQLLALWDDKTLIEHTVERFSKNIPQENVWIVTTEALVAPTRAALGPKLAEVRFLGEPAAKNTAACILWGLHEIARVDADAVIAVMPADHYIGDAKAFNDALAAAVAHAKSAGALVTLGIKPNRPETGFGYIEIAEAPKPGKRAPVAVEVRRFFEKPDMRTAIRYIESGKFLWNAGMFILTAKTGLEAFGKTMPELSALFAKAYEGGVFSAAAVYGQIRKQDSVSVDYGVMEVASSKGILVSIVPVDCGWNDVGSFPALEEINCTTHGEVVSLDANCNIVQCDAGIVALLGVHDLVVVRDGDVVLVTSKERSQDIKQLLDKVRIAHADKL